MLADGAQEDGVNPPVYVNGNKAVFEHIGIMGPGKYKSVILLEKL